MKRITDRRRKRALAANPALEKSGASKLKRGAAVRVHALVGLPLEQLTHNGGEDRQQRTRIGAARLGADAN